MYTRCPHCETWFAIGAAQLRLGRGEVQCGTCFETFDALATLADAPSAESPPRLASGPAARFEVLDAPHPADGDAEPAARATPPIGDMALLAARPASDGTGRPAEPEAGPLPVIEEEGNDRARLSAGGAPGVDLEAFPPVLPEPVEPEAAVAPTGPRLAGEFERVPDVLWEDMARLAAGRMARRLRYVEAGPGAIFFSCDDSRWR